MEDMEHLAEELLAVPRSRQQFFSDTPFPVAPLEGFLPPLSPNALSNPASMLDELPILAPGSPSSLVPPPVPLPPPPPPLADTEGPARSPAQTKTNCDSCKVSHVKCNGQQPCLRCYRNHMECTYGAFKVVRGPKGDHIREIRHKIQKLEEQAYAQQTSIDGLLRSAAQDERNAESKRRRYTISPFVPAMNLRFVLDLYTHAFRSSETRLGLWSEMINTSPSIESCEQLMQLPYNLHDLNKIRPIFRMYSYFANAAQVYGAPDHAKEFGARARLAALQLYDVTDEHVAGGMHFLGYYFHRAGDMPRARLLNKLVLTACESLSLPVGAALRRHAMMTRGLLATDTNERRLIMAQMREAPLEDCRYSTWINSWLELYIEIHAWRDAGCPPGGADINVLERLLLEFQSASQCSISDSTARQLMVMGFAAMVRLAAGDNQGALRLANTCIRGLQVYGSDCAGQLLILSILMPAAEFCAFIHNRLGQLRMLNEDVTFFGYVGARIPICKSAVAHHESVLTVLRPDQTSPPGTQAGSLSGSPPQARSPPLPARKPLAMFTEDVTARQL